MISVNKIVNKIIKFSVVGGIATIIDFVFLYIFKEFFNFNVILANTLSFIISVTYNYIASITWVFDTNKNKNKKIQFYTIFLAQFKKKYYLCRKFTTIAEKTWNYHLQKRGKSRWLNPSVSRVVRSVKCGFAKLTTTCLC